MSANIPPIGCFLLFVAAIGIGCEQGGPEAAVPAVSAAASSGVDAPGADGNTSGPSRDSATATATGDAQDSGSAAGSGVDDTPPAIDFADLGEARPWNLIDQELRFPDALMELNGQRVSLVGFMAPYDSLDNMRHCMILPSYVGCNFCAPPRMNQVVYVTQGGGDDDSGSFPFVEEASHVTGTLRLSLPGTESEGQTQGFMYSIEDAVVSVHRGEAPSRQADHGNEPHARADSRLLKISYEELVDEVAEVVGRAPIRPIEFELVSPESFGEIVQSRLGVLYPEATRADRVLAFGLLGLLPDDVGATDWIEVLTEHRLASRAATAGVAGDRVFVRHNMTTDDHFTRLMLVGDIADAIARQHFPDGASDRDAGSDDAQRARAALRQGFRTLAIHRYARARDLSSAARQPARFVHETRVRRRGKLELRLTLQSAQFGLWLEVPRAVGPFFVESLVGDADPLTLVDPAFANPPTTTMEFFRPRWYQDDALWHRDPVPSNFADDLMDAPPVLTDELGIGGLIPMLTQWYAIDVAKTLTGAWAGDRWALWELPSGGSALVLETRWQDEVSADQFLNAIPVNAPGWHLVPRESGSTRVRLLRAESEDDLRRLIAALDGES